MEEERLEAGRLAQDHWGEAGGADWETMNTEEGTGRRRAYLRGVLRTGILA